MIHRPEHLITEKQIAAITTRLVAVTGQDYRLTCDKRDPARVLCEWSTVSHQDVILTISPSSERGLYNVSWGRNSGADGIVTMGEAVMDRGHVDALLRDPGHVIGVFFGQRRLGLSA